MSSPESELTSSEPRSLRRDAEQNRQRILRAAAEVFTERGLEATLDEVARQAGVGVGTVYRRFADKSALADALFEQRIDALAAIAERAESDADPWRALVSFLERAAEMLAADRGLRQILMFAAAGHERCNYARERMRPVLQRVLARAQAAGVVRADLAATDLPIIELIVGAAAEYCQPVRPDVWRRYLTLIVDGLRPARDSVSPLPGPPLDPGELAEAINANPVGRPHARPRSEPRSVRALPD